ncbi:MAG: hypothetical protein ACYDBQ_03260 [Thermoplasmatota archaeon]
MARRLALVLLVLAGCAAPPTPGSCQALLEAPHPAGTLVAPAFTGTVADVAGRFSAALADPLVGPASGPRTIHPGGANATQWGWSTAAGTMGLIEQAGAWTVSYVRAGTWPSANASGARPVLEGILTGMGVPVDLARSWQDASSGRGYRLELFQLHDGRPMQDDTSIPAAVASLRVDAAGLTGALRLSPLRCIAPDAPHVAPDAANATALAFAGARLSAGNVTFSAFGFHTLEFAGDRLVYTIPVWFQDAGGHTCPPHGSVVQVDAMTGTPSYAGPLTGCVAPDARPPA